MKKMFVSMMAVAMSLCSMASNTITITLNGDNGDANYESSVVLVEDAARNATYEAGYDAECLSTDPSGILGVMFYGFVGTKKCEFIYADDLHGIQFGFTSNVTETQYHLYISSNFTNSYQLYDNVTDQYIALDGSVADYAFTATAGRVNVENRFSIYAPAPTSYTVTPNSFGYASFSAAEATVIPTTGVTVYKGAINGEVLDLSPITDYIPANTGVIVMGTAGQPYEFEVTSAAVADLSDNALKAYTDWASHSGTIYVLKDEALYRYTGSDFPDNKAYLQISAANNAPKRISLRFNQTTAIDNVEVGAQAEKFVENGQIYIRRGNEVFNLQGQIVK